MGYGAASDFEIFASEARTATHNSAFFKNTFNARGVRLFISSTDVTDTPSVTFAIQIYDKRANVYHTVLTSAAVTTEANSYIEVYPDGAATANVRFVTHIGKGFRVVATHADADSITYSVNAEWLP